MAEHVVYVDKLHPVAQEIVQEALPPGFTWACLKDGSEDEAVAALEGIRVAIIATFPVTEGFLSRVPSLKFIQAQGVGLDNFDLEALRRHGVLLAIDPAGFESVAEHNILLILAASRRLPLADKRLRNGIWERWSLRRVSRDLKGKTVGLAGFGRNARAVAQRLQGFGCRVVFTDVVDPQPPLYGANRVSEDELLSESDVLCLHLPLNSSTHHWLDAARMDRMKPGAIVINTARGDLLDEKELVTRLKDGRIGAAGLDVYEPEPPLKDSGLWALDNVVVTPHIAAGTLEAYQEKMEFAFANIQRFLAGLTPVNLV